METPAPNSFTRRHKLFFGLIIAVGVLLYASFNLWVWRWSNSGKAPSPAALRQMLKPSDGSVPRLNPTKSAPPVIPTNVGIQHTTTLTPSATPTPLEGPGMYACSPDGDCNVYSNEMRRQYCTQTYADSQCLDQCGDKSKLCTK